MKIIAFYLPQYHTIPENDVWWGEGFTEWFNVRKAKSLFVGHHQPQIPINGNYYDLLDGDTQISQVHLAKKYGVYGFCYYHYWFNGKLLLEKPMENMLGNDKVDIPFCVCWANETWSRTWDGKDSEILIEQNYEEGYEGWKSHFEYLLPFFEDARYIKEDGKPMIIIYKPQLIKSFEGMKKCWDELAVEAGFPGLYWGYQHRSAFDDDTVRNTFDFGIEFEPFYTVREIENERAAKEANRGEIQQGLAKALKFLTKCFKRVLHLPIFYNYDDVWRRIIKRIPEGNKVMPGAFTEWDNTPRKGRKGVVFHGAEPTKFSKYIKQQIARAETVYKSDYLFINAWNEWAEGAHLEPDERNRYSYLEVIGETLGKS